RDEKASPTPGCFEPSPPHCRERSARGGHTGCRSRRELKRVDKGRLRLVRSCSLVALSMLRCSSSSLPHRAMESRLLARDVRSLEELREEKQATNVRHSDHEEEERQLELGCIDVGRKVHGDVHVSLLGVASRMMTGARLAWASVPFRSTSQASAPRS